MLVVFNIMIMSMMTIMIVVLVKNMIVCQNDSVIGSIDYNKKIMFVGSNTAEFESHIYSLNNMISTGRSAQ